MPERIPGCEGRGALCLPLRSFACLFEEPLDERIDRFLILDDGKHRLAERAPCYGEVASIAIDFLAVLLEPCAGELALHQDVQTGPGRAELGIAPKAPDPLLRLFVD